MKLLLDTQVLLWWLENSPRLGGRARKAIGRADVVFVSVASGWEAAIKISLGRLEIPSVASIVTEPGAFHPTSLGPRPG